MVPSGAAIGFPGWAAMPSKTETVALRLMRALYDATDGRPMQWLSLEGLDVPETDEAVRYAVTRGWMMVEGGQSSA